MWTVDPEQIWRKARAPGISGFMRLKNEATFLDRAIATHLQGLDELIIVLNDCSDNTPEICASWKHRFPEKIRVFEYEPSVVPIGTPDSLTIDPRSPRCIANYYNFALALTNRKIVIKIDGDHYAIADRFNNICTRVRKRLSRKDYYPIYGLNVTMDHGEIVIYNFYDFAPEARGDRAKKQGPPPFTAGDHAFYYVDETCWHTVDPVEGFEVMDLSKKSRYPGAALTYTFLHLKGMKVDRGTTNWDVSAAGAEHGRATWTQNVLSPDPADLTTVEAMRRHNPAYFRGIDVVQELREAFPEIPVRPARSELLPSIRVRERLADLWYRVWYP